MEDGGGVVRASASGYLQFIRHDVLVQFAAEADAVISLSYRPGTSWFRATRSRWSGRPGRRPRESEALGRAHITGPVRTLAEDVSFGSTSSSRAPRPSA
jgi:uncharacterized membrane protein